MILLKREKNIDYIVAVRSTDVNLFFKYIFYLRGIGIQIMKEAKKIVCESYTWSKNTQRLIKIYNETI